jgi:hypothetical protein
MGFIGNDVKNGIWMTLNGGALLVNNKKCLFILFKIFKFTYRTSVENWSKP